MPWYHLHLSCQDRTLLKISTMLRTTIEAANPLTYILIQSSRKGSLSVPWSVASSCYATSFSWTVLFIHQVRHQEILGGCRNGVGCSSVSYPQTLQQYHPPFAGQRANECSKDGTSSSTCRRQFSVGRWCRIIWYNSSQTLSISKFLFQASKQQSAGRIFFLPLRCWSHIFM